MLHTLPLVAIIVSVVLNFVTAIALLYPPKIAGTRIKYRVRCWVCVILGLSYTVYAALLSSAMEPSIVCGVGVTIVHCLLLSAVLWMFLDVLNGAYDVMGLERKLVGATLNKVVCFSQSIPALVFAGSIAWDFFKYSDLDTLKGDTSGERCWYHPMSYWLLWNLPAILLLLITLAICYSIGSMFKCGRIFSFADKGKDIAWFRQTMVISLLFTCTVITSSFGDATGTQSRVVHQATFSMSYFLLSLVILYCWVLGKRDVLSFWLSCPRNISIDCLTCGLCVLEIPEEQSMYANKSGTSKDTLDTLSLTSVCSGVCRHVNKKCTPHLIVDVLQPEERERKNSKVQFKEDTEVIVEVRPLSAMSHTSDQPVKGIIRRDSSQSTPTMEGRPEGYTDTPVPSPVDTSPVTAQPHLDMTYERDNEQPCSSRTQFDRELEMMIQRRESLGPPNLIIPVPQPSPEPCQAKEAKVDEFALCLGQLMYEYESKTGKVPVPGAVYTPSSEGSPQESTTRFSQCLNELIQDYEKATTPSPTTPTPPVKPIAQAFTGAETVIVRTPVEQLIDFNKPVFVLPPPQVEPVRPEGSMAAMLQRHLEKQDSDDVSLD